MAGLSSTTTCTISLISQFILWLGNIHLLFIRLRRELGPQKSNDFLIWGHSRDLEWLLSVRGLSRDLEWFLSVRGHSWNLEWLLSVLWMLVYLSHVWRASSLPLVTLMVSLPGSLQNARHTDTVQLLNKAEFLLKRFLPHIIKWKEKLCITFLMSVTLGLRIKVISTLMSECIIQKPKTIAVLEKP